MYLSFSDAIENTFYFSRNFEFIYYFVTFLPTFFQVILARVFTYYNMLIPSLTRESLFFLRIWNI